MVEFDGEGCQINKNLSTRLLESSAFNVKRKRKTNGGFPLGQGA